MLRCHDPVDSEQTTKMADGYLNPQYSSTAIFVACAESTEDSGKHLRFLNPC